MSPSWTTQSLTAGQQQQQTGSGSGTTFPTPPSTSGIHSHMSGYGGSDSAQQTPAGDEEADVRRSDENRRRDGDGDAEMTDAKTVDAEHRRTDHERDAAGGDTAAASKLTAPTSTSASTGPPLPGAGVLYRLRTARKYSLRARHIPALMVHC